MVTSSSPLSSRPTTIGNVRSGSSRCRTTSPPNAANSTWHAISGSRRPSGSFEADPTRSFRFTGRSSSPRSSTARTRGSTPSWATLPSREEHALRGSGQGYSDWLKTIHEESHGNADLVAHFFRRAFNLLRQGGAFGLIATNTIGQGDTRSTGLRWICNHGGTIYAATRRKKWPGQAA